MPLGPATNASNSATNLNHKKGTVITQRHDAPPPQPCNAKSDQEIPPEHRHRSKQAPTELGKHYFDLGLCPIDALTPPGTSLLCQQQCHTLDNDRNHTET